MAGESRRPIAAVAALSLALLVLLAPGCGGGGGEGKSGSGSSSAAADAAARIEDFGSEASGSEAKRAEAALHRYLDARSAGEWANACSDLAKPSRHLLDRIAVRSTQIDGEGCAAAMAYLTQRLSSSERTDLAKADVESVRVEGDQGYVIYAGAGGTRYAIRATVEGDRWGFSVSALALG